MQIELLLSAMILARTPIRRVEVEFDSPSGSMRLEYAATDAEARHFAAAMVERGYRVVIDRRIRTELPPLPCSRLWRYG